jgi:hypothetical protein
MRIDRSHVPWAIGTGLATVLVSVIYLAYFHPEVLPFKVAFPSVIEEAPRTRNSAGATPIGFIYGTLALLIFVFAAALGIRKKKRLWRIGHVNLWLKAHIWLTLFTIPLVLLHCGFKLGGPHTTVLFWLYVVVMASGIYGIALQHYMPRLMKERLPREVVFEQIPNLRKRIYESTLTFRGQLHRGMQGDEKAAALATGSAPPKPGAAAAPVMTAEDSSPQVLLDFLDDELLPYLRSGRSARLAEKRSSDDVFRLLKLNVSDMFRAKVEEIQGWVDDFRMMAVQARMHYWLHAWLIVHVPVSFILLVWTFWHAYITWVYL